jgi:DNA polymerase-1
LQTLPGKKSGESTAIRDCILPRSEDSRLLAIDYDGQELRVFASYSGDPNLIQAITEQPDPHAWVAELVYGHVTPQLREIAKNVGYARIYGAGPDKMAATAGVPVDVIKDFLSKYDAVLPGVATFMHSVEDVARRRMAEEGGNPYVTSTGGRRLEAEPDKVYKLVNFLIQGSCADLLKQKIVDLDSLGYGDLITLPVHDELLFDIPTAEIPEVLPELVACMTETERFAVPLTVHPSKPLTRWGDVAR